MNANDYLTKNRLLLGMGLGAVIALGFLSYSFFRNNRITIDLYRSIQMLDTIELANEKVADSLQTLEVERVVTTKDECLEMKLNLVSQLNAKVSRLQGSLKDPFLPPFESGLFICELGESHRLLFNKFNFYRNHLLVVTKEFLLQSSPLSVLDLEEAIHIYRALGGMFFFNRGPNSGASQKHKHIQIFPAEAKNLPIYRLMETFQHPQV